MVFGWKGIVHYELLPLGQTINSALYCEQLERLRQAIERKRPELINRKDIVLHHDSAWPHTSLMTCQKLREIGWAVLMYPLYNPDITPSDYHLIRSLHNSLHRTKLASREACKNHSIQFFNQKPQKFYTDGIMALPEKWRNIVDNNGEYLHCRPKVSGHLRNYTELISKFERSLHSSNLHVHDNYSYLL